MKISRVNEMRNLDRRAIEKQHVSQELLDAKRNLQDELERTEERIGALEERSDFQKSSAGNAR